MDRAREWRLEMPLMAGREGKGLGGGAFTLSVEQHLVLVVKGGKCFHWPAPSRNPSRLIFVPSEQDISQRLFNTDADLLLVWDWYL